MANASDISVGLAHEVVIRLVGAGAEVGDLTKLSKDGGLCEKVVRLIRGAVEVVTAKLLDFVGTVKIAATTAKFIAKEKFVVDTGRKAKVKISYLGDNFVAWFLSGSGKTEDLIGEQTLRYAKLRQSSLDGPIIAELGGEAKAEATLSEIFFLMGRQKDGEDGVLLNNGYANIFYIRADSGLLRAVGVGWGGDGWSVGACEVADPGGWYGDCQVFSRNS